MAYDEARRNRSPRVSSYFQIKKPQNAYVSEAQYVFIASKSPLEILLRFLFFRIHLNNLPAFESEVFFVGDVAELVAEAAGGADGLVDVSVGVAVDPVVDTAVGDVIGQLDGECTVDTAALELWGNQLIGRDVVGNNDFVLGLAGTDGLLDEVKAVLVFAVEIGIPQQIFAINDAVEVSHAPFGDEGVVKVNMCPQGGNDEVHIPDRDDLVIVVVDVGADFANQSVLHRL